MTEFTVSITKKPLGITFGHTDDNSLAINSVSPNSLAHALGLLRGDLLISINSTYVLNMASLTVANLFNIQSTPFNLTFYRFDTNNSDSTSATNASDNENENENTNDISFTNYNNLNYISSNNSTPYSISNETKISNININSTYKNNDLYEQEPSECSLSLESKNLYSNGNDKINQNRFADLSPINTDLEFITLKDNVITPFDEYNNEYDSIYSSDNENENENECNIGIIDCINMFDKYKIFNNKYMILTSNNGFNFGIHEWSIKILQIDDKIQEIGIISNNNLNDINNINKCILNTNAFGARAIYGTHKMLNNYYASFNNNGYCRINKNLKNKNGWCIGDIIKIILNLNKGIIIFYKNNKKVRKIISVQKQKWIMYYPFIAFSGNCKYKLL